MVEQISHLRMAAQSWSKSLKQMRAVVNTLLTAWLKTEASLPILSFTGTTTWLTCSSVKTHLLVYNSLSFSKLRSLKTCNQSIKLKSFTLQTAAVKLHKQGARSKLTNQRPLALSQTWLRNLSKLRRQTENWKSIRTSTKSFMRRSWKQTPKTWITGRARIHSTSQSLRVKTTWILSITGQEALSWLTPQARHLQLMIKWEGLNKVFKNNTGSLKSSTTSLQSMFLNPAKSQFLVIVSKNQSLRKYLLTSCKTNESLYLKNLSQTSWSSHSKAWIRCSNCNESMRKFKLDGKT